MLYTVSIVIWACLGFWSFAKYSVGHDDYYLYLGFVQVFAAVMWFVKKSKIKGQVDVR